MSRWDALKPSSTKRETNHNKHHRTTGTAAASGVRRAAAQHPPSPLWQRIVPLENDDADDTIVLSRYAELREKAYCRLSNAADDVSALASFVAANCDNLPAEETAVTVVHDILLPALTATTDNDGAAKNDVTAIILMAVHTLLLDDRHSSAMLASLTDHVETGTGAEQVLLNPVRCRLLDVLQQTLPLSAVCLTTALQAATRIHGSGTTSNSNNHTKQRSTVSHGPKNTASAKMDVDIHTIQDYLDSAFANGNVPHQETALHLLLALLHRHPVQASSQLVRFLLFRNRNNHYYYDSATTTTTRLEDSPASATRCCPTCGFVSSTCDGAPIFVQLLHATTTTTTTTTNHGATTCGGVAMECATELLRTLPWTLWLVGNNNNNYANNNGTCTKTPLPSYFQSRVAAAAVEDLVRIALCCCCCSSSRSSSTIDSQSYCSFVKALLTQVPYGSGYCYEGLAVTLVGKLAETMRHHHHESITALLIECLGGCMTPNGQLTATSLPVATWLHSPDGRAVFEQTLLLTTAPAQSTTNKWMYAVLRACPYVVLGDNNDTSWSRFQSAVENHLQNEKLLLSAQWIEGLLRGRKDCIKEAKLLANKLLAFVLPKLEMFISAEISEQVQCTGCAAFSCVLLTDWAVISAPERCIARVLALCSDDSTAVKTASCKAVGDICTNYVPNAQLGDGAAGTILCNKILRVMHQAMKEGNPVSVQCMALFAVGNLTHALYHRSTVRLDARLVNTVAESSLDCWLV
jgi:hypothetical protein